MSRHSGQDNQVRGLWAAIFSDVHFWVPVVVLISGLVVLRWIS